MRRLAILLALLVPTSASAGDGALLAAKERYLPAVQSRYASTPAGAQARYDAGRDLVEAVLAAGPVSAGRRALRTDLLARGRAQVARAEALDRADGFRSVGPLAPLPGTGTGVAPRRFDTALARRLAAVAGRARGRSASGSTISARAATRGSSRTRASQLRRRSSSVRWSPGCARRRGRSAAAGGTTCASSASGRRTWRRTGSPEVSATRRSVTGCAGSG